MILSEPRIQFYLWLTLLVLAIFLTKRALRPRPRIPWKLGNLTVDLRGGSHTIHAVVAGMSGTGKSTAVLSLLQGEMPALVVAFDNSRPIRELFEAYGWTIWQPGGNIGWNILSGSPQVVSEVLTAGFARTDADTGYNRGLAQMRLWETLEDLDAMGEQRTLTALVDALERPGKNPDDTRACRTWANRFNRIAKSLGASLGNDLDLSECMRRGEKVLILPNRFLSPEDAPIIGGIALVQARRVAQEVGNFLIVVEEAGQAGNRQVEMNALAQAGRDRGCPLIVLTQNMAKLPEEVVNNVKVWVSFAQESKREVTFAADRLRVDPELLQVETMPTGYAWIRSPEHASTRQRLNLPRSPKRDTLPLELRDTPVGHKPRVIIREVLPTPVVGLPALPPPTGLNAVLAAGLYRDGECERWRGDHNDRGYGRVRLPDGRREYVHRLRWELAYGPIPLAADGMRMTIDHRRTCAKDCSRLDHLEMVTRQVNSERRWRVRGVAAAD